MNICIEKVHYINPLRDKRWADYTVKRLITTLHRQSRPRVSQTVECFQDDWSPQRGTHALNHLKHNLLIFFQIFKLWISFWFNFRLVLGNRSKKRFYHKIFKFRMITSSKRKSSSEQSTSSITFLVLFLCFLIKCCQLVFSCAIFNAIRGFAPRNGYTERFSV